MAPPIENVKHLLNVMLKFWPEFPVTAANLTSPSSKFVVEFCENFFTELYNYYNRVVNDEFPIVIPDVPEFSKEINLCQKMSSILVKLNMEVINVTGFYVPIAKTMFLIFKVAIYFLINTNNIETSLQDLVASVTNRSLEANNLRSVKQNMLQEINENAVEIAKCEDTRETEMHKLEADKIKYEAMLMEKEKKEIFYTEYNAEGDNLKRECSNLKYELEGLNQKEKDLQEHIITKEDFANLQHTVKCLEEEFELLCQNEVEVGDKQCDDQHKQAVSYVQYIEHLEPLSFDTLPVAALIAQIEKTKNLKIQQMDLEKEIVQLEVVKKNVVNNIKQREDDKYKNKQQEENFDLQIEEDLKNEKMALDEKMAQNKVNHSWYDAILEQIAVEIEQIKSISKSNEQFDYKISKNYKEILDSERAVTNRFFGILHQLCQKVSIHSSRIY